MPDPLAWVSEPYRSRYHDPASALWERLALVTLPPEPTGGTRMPWTPEQRREAHRREVVEHAILWCEHLRRPDWDPWKPQRERDADVLADLDTIRNAARRLADGMKGRAAQMDVLAALAAKGAGVALEQQDPDQSMCDGLAAWLRNISRDLSEHGPVAKAGPHAHRTRVGPLRFGRPIDGPGAVREPSTVLAICLSDMFRRATSGDARLWPLCQDGEPVVVAGGDPLWEIVAAFARAAGLATENWDGRRARTAARKVLDAHPHNNEVAAVSVSRKNRET